MTSSTPPIPLKVLHIASGDLWAGAEVQLFTLLTQFQRNDNVEVHVALLNEGELAKRLRDQKISVTVYDESRLNGAQIVRQLRRLMRTVRPSCIHTHRQKENVLGSIANLLSIAVPCVRTSHGAPEHHHNWRKPHKRLFASLDIFCGNYLQQRIIAVSAGLATTLRQHFSPKKIVVIENGVDTEALNTMALQVDLRSSALDAIHVGIVGRLEQVKRVDLFLQMAAFLSLQAPDKAWRFHVIGEGSLRHKLEQQAEELGISALVQFHGHRVDSVACLASLDAMVMCSDHEGMPMTPLEAIAVGTLVVAHDVGGLLDILGNEAGGVLNRKHSGQGYAEALLNLLALDKNELIARGRLRLETRFSAIQNAKRTLALYRELTH